MLFKRCPECGKFIKNYDSVWECHTPYAKKAGVKTGMVTWEAK